MRFEGKTAIVTGGARGIGRAIVERLASEGGNVLIADIDDATGKSVAAEIGKSALAFGLDVTNEDSWNQAVAAATASWGKVDILVNNAGIAGRSAPAWELTVNEWLEVINIDLTGVFLGCRAVAAGHDPARLWPDREHRLDRRQGGQPECGALFGREVGRDRADEVDREGSRDQGRDRQCHHPGGH